MSRRCAAIARIDDILFEQGFGTRRECAGLIASGAVAVAGRAVQDGAETYATDALVFHVSGTAWAYHQPAIVLLHKPAGYECSQKPSAWPSVLTLLPVPLRRRGVQPVGRLDQDTTGALLLTDDGALLHRWTSPKHHVPKVYEVRTARAVTDAQITRLLEGVVLDDDPAPVRATHAQITGECAMQMTLVQGKYHQVKRMLAAVGNHVEGLHRSAYGQLQLTADLAPGQWRWVGTPAEVA